MVKNNFSLYEIDNYILNCFDEETGEILDEELLNALEIAKDKKIENIACFIKNLNLEAAAIKTEIDNLKKRMESKVKKADSLKKYLSGHLDRNKFETSRCCINVRKTESVNAPDVNLLDEKFIRVKTSIEPDKTAIKKALKAGEEVKGASLVTGKSITII